ncbi:MAG: glycosyltransferase family 4 protein [bacterium]
MSADRCNLLLLTVDFPPAVGGVATYLAHYATRYRTGEVRVLAPTVDGTDGSAFGSVQVERRRLEVGWLRPRWLPTLFWLWRSVRRQRPDLILVSHLMNMGKAARLVGRLTGVPYAVIVHGMDVALVLNGNGGRDRRAARRVLGDAAAVIANSRYTAGLVDKLTEGRVRAEVVLPPPSMPLDAPERIPAATAENFLRRHGLTGSDLVLLTICRLVRRKGIDDELKVLRILVDEGLSVQLLIAGDGPDRERLEKLAEELNLESSVAFLGRLSEADLHAALSACDVFVLTPHASGGDQEGFGIVYVEAGLFGKSTVGTRTGGVPEAVLEDETGLLADEGDPTSLAAALRQLVQDKELRQRLGESGRRRVETDYGQDRQVRQLEEILIRATGPKA